MRFEDVAEAKIISSDSTEKRTFIKLVKKIDGELNKSSDKEFYEKLSQMLEMGSITANEYQEISFKQKSLKYLKSVINDLLEKEEINKEFLEDY